MKKRNTQNPIVQTIKKFFLSAFVVVTFVAYSLANHWGVGNTSTPVTAGPVPTQKVAPDTQTPNTIIAPNPVAPPTAVAVAPTATPENTATSPAPQVASNGMKDGTYTGPTVDVDWGLVQVQATIQSGRLSDVQIVQYPTDRRTSRRINSVAVPQLQQEAIQAQSANVDIVTGATLTSEGFQMSLQAALQQAKGI